MKEKKKKEANMTANMEDYENGQQLTREDFLKNFSLRKEKKPPKKKEVKIMTAEEEERLVKEEAKRIKEDQQAVQDQMDAADVAQLFKEKQEVTRSEYERDALLTRVRGRSSKERMLHPVHGDNEEILGYKAVDTDNPFNEIFDEDMTTANLDSDELNVIREHCNLSNFSQALSQSTGINLVDCQNFYKNQLKSFLISSKAKNGFAAWLVKTDKSISEGTIERIQKEVEEKRRKKWGLF